MFTGLIVGDDVHGIFILSSIDICSLCIASRPRRFSCGISVTTKFNICPLALSGMLATRWNCPITLIGCLDADSYCASVGSKFGRSSFSQMSAVMKFSHAPVSNSIVNSTPSICNFCCNCDRDSILLTVEVITLTGCDVDFFLSRHADSM